MTANPSRRPSMLKALVSAGIIGASALALAGCGGSSSSGSAAQAQTARATPLQSNPDVGQADAQQAPAAGARGDSKHGTARASAQQESSGQPAAAKESSSRTGSPSSARLVPSGRVQKARPAAPGAATEDGVPTVGKAINPCRLVRRSEAQSIIGHSVTASVVAPLGPTCIYESDGSKANVTLAVEAAKLAQIAPQLRSRTRVTVGGREAFCGRLGTEMLLVPVAAGHVLTVSAPCGVAQRFAALALSRLVS